MNGYHARWLSNTRDLPSDITLGTVGFHVYDNIVRYLQRAALSCDCRWQRADADRGSHVLGRRDTMSQQGQRALSRPQYRHSVLPRHTAQLSSTRDVGCMYHELVQ